MYTPWGQAQTQTDCGHGVIHVTTSSHGGFFVEKSERHKLPVQETNFSRNGFFEEDIDWVIVALSIPEAFPPEHIELAKKIAANDPYMKNLLKAA
jgi:hypothetical protein